MIIRTQLNGRPVEADVSLGLGAKSGSGNITVHVALYMDNNDFEEVAEIDMQQVQDQVLETIERGEV